MRLGKLFSFAVKEITSIISSLWLQTSLFEVRNVDEKRGMHETSSLALEPEMPVLTNIVLSSELVWELGPL